MTDTTTPRLVDARALSACLSVREATIRAWTRTTDMPRIRCGRLVRFDVAEVVAWLRARTVR